ncbi:MAG TPA: RNA-binding protein, partial [Flavisolibacter sp.]
QYATVNGMVADDFDGDGNLDICFATNDYSTEPGNGRYDALNGLLLKGDGNGGFAALSMLQSGICISGNGKGLAKLKSSNGAYLMAATQNRGPLQVYRNKMPVRVIAAAPGDAFALLHLKNGKTQKIECYYGTSFLSQSGRFFTVSGAVTSVEMFDYKGNKRAVVLK